MLMGVYTTSCIVQPYAHEKNRSPNTSSSNQSSNAIFDLGSTVVGYIVEASQGIM